MPLAVTDIVSLATLKAHSRLLSGTSEDALLALYLGAAVDLVERHTSRALLDKQRTFRAARWEGLRLPYAPLLSIVSLTYRDENGATQTLDTSAYSVRNAAQEDRRGLLLPAVGTEWPALQELEQDGQITVTYTAGRASADDIPSGLKLAVLHVAASFYEQRLPLADIEHYELPFNLRALLDSFKLPSF